MQEEMPDSRLRHARPKHIRLLLFIAIGILATIAICLGYLTFNNSGPIPRHYRKGLDFAIYYPTRLPEGYSVDGASLERKGDSILFSIHTPNGKNIVVSQQKTPPGGIPRESSPAPFQVPGEKSFSTAIGLAHIGLWGDKYVSDIATAEGTWLILNVTGFTAKEAIAVTQSFTKIK
jgi:hypothetical protein